MLNNLNSNFLRPNWDKPMDQSDPFESALSSIASSPTASNPDTNAQNLVLRQLNNSCYATPLNPPNLNLSADPAFADRAARFSCFANHHSIGSQPAVEENWESAATDSRENSAVSDQIATCRKRKSATKGKPKESTTPPSRDANTSENSESSAKRSKSPAAEAPKDYIHVRARRGEAKDPHSLAERVRREKIGERMKILQDLVPGCNKVTGKAVMLDEIINYVQSLQHQVEFLSMKLATVNPRMDFNMEAALMSKDIMFQSRVSLQHNMGSYAVPRGAETPTNLNAGRHQSLQLDSLGDAASQVSSFWEEDLHSIVQMGFRQQHFQGRSLPTTQMKVEL